MTKEEKAERNSKISSFVYANYHASSYENYGSGRIFSYFLNYYKKTNTIKFALFQKKETIDVKKVEEFLKENNIHYLQVRCVPGWQYNSLIISFDKEH